MQNGKLLYFEITKEDGESAQLLMIDERDYAQYSANVTLKGFRQANKYSGIYDSLSEVLEDIKHNAEIASFSADFTSFSREGEVIF